jgi:hypothetical protein
MYVYMLYSIIATHEYHIVEQGWYGFIKILQLLIYIFTNVCLKTYNNMMYSRSYLCLESYCNCWHLFSPLLSRDENFCIELFIYYWTLHLFWWNFLLNQLIHIFILGDEGYFHSHSKTNDKKLKTDSSNFSRSILK